MMDRVKTYTKAVWQVVPTLAIILVVAISLFTQAPPLPALLVVLLVASVLLYLKRERFRRFRLVLMDTFALKRKKAGNRKRKLKQRGNIIQFPKK